MDKEYWNSLPFKPFGIKQSLSSKIKKLIKNNTNVFLYLLSIFFFFSIGSFLNGIDKSKEIQNMKVISNLQEKLLIEEKKTVGLLEAEVEKLKSHMQEYDKEPKEEIVRYILSTYKKTPKKVANEIANIILKKATEFNLPWVTVVGMTEVESQFNPYLVSNKGARGPMQVMFSVWGKKFKIPSKYTLHDIEDGIHYGCKVLRHYLDYTKGNLTKALYRYLGGPDPMRRVKPSAAQKAYAEDVYAATGRFISFRTMPPEPIDEEVIEPITEVKNIDLKRTEHTNNKQFIEIEEIELNTIHIIRLGDLLSNIAKWYTGNSNNWRLIQDLNPSLKPTRLYIGQKVIIPNNMVKTKTLMPVGFGTNPEKGEAENAD